MIAIAAPALALAVQSMDQMRHHRRVVVASAPTVDAATLAGQRAAIGGWHGARERDVTLVTIAGDQVAGATDSAATLRHRYALPADRFEVVLVGKDGHVAARSDALLDAGRLQSLIDAMPMRRAGQR